MTNKVKLKIVSYLVLLFRFFLPFIVIATTYITIDSSPKVTIGVIGMLLLLILSLSLLKYAKKRIIIRQQSGFKPSPYKVMVVNYLPSTLILIAFAGFLKIIQDDMEKLSNVILVIAVSVTVSFIISFWQVHYEKLVSQE